MSTSEYKTSFTWRTQKSNTPLSAEEKVQYAEQMLNLTDKLYGHMASTQIEYDTFQVSLKIAPKITPQMRQAAEDQAKKITFNGFLGFYTSLLLFFKGMRQAYKYTISKQLSERILLRHQHEICLQMEQQFFSTLEIATHIHQKIKQNKHNDPV